MPRPKTFDEVAALDAALGVFWARGYESASTADLIAAMGIGRQSLYDTFGDKHQLYLRALERYRERGAAMVAGILAADPDPVSAVMALVRRAARSPACDRQKGCMLVNAVTERAPADPAVLAVVQDGIQALEQAIAATLARHRPADRPAPGRNPADAARLAVITMHGVAVMAKAGAEPAALERAVDGLERALRS